MERQQQPAGAGEEQSMAEEQTAARTPEPATEPSETPAATPVAAEAAVASEPASAKPKSRKQVKVGRVVSNKNDKTVVVAVDYLRRHRLYRKMLRRTSRFHAHDEHNECQMGDLVRIVESRPLSKLKRWRVTEIIQRAVQV